MTHHCAICGTEWSAETGVVVGHPVENHLCDICFDADITPILRGHNADPARPTDEPCIAHWNVGDTRVGVPLPEKNDLGC